MMDRDKLRRVAEALGDVRLYEKHHTGELITMRLRDSLADNPGYDAEEVDKTLLELARVALEAAE
ncbi:hypothetical protein CRT60_26545 [Azospirillum palustre]|uniref:Uncharacterized protein n=1 Tax=Azospirillum palustre TaxID=2044885 RepID=A0A2B8B869_9PROT|nr:hypothetical protein [Azospirillum palustre]PGH53447.1 hypothetical protein CRT60_26545 [Azospirillum palustre]